MSLLRWIVIPKNTKVVQIGAFVMPAETWLLVSLDGLIVENDGKKKPLEIKFPYSCRSLPIFDSTKNNLDVGI